MSSSLQSIALSSSEHTNRTPASSLQSDGNSPNSSENTNRVSIDADRIDLGSASTVEQMNDDDSTSTAVDMAHTPTRANTSSHDSSSTKANRRPIGNKTKRRSENSPTTYENPMTSHSITSNPDPSFIRALEEFDRNIDGAIAAVGNTSGPTTNPEQPSAISSSFLPGFRDASNATSLAHDDTGEVSFAQGIATGTFTHPIQQAQAIGLLSDLSSVIGGERVFTHTGTLTAPSTNAHHVPTGVQAQVDTSAVQGTQPGNNTTPQVVNLDDDSSHHDSNEDEEDKNDHPDGHQDTDPQIGTTEALKKNKLVHPHDAFSHWSQEWLQVKDAHGDWFKPACIKVLAHFQKVFKNDWASFYTYCEVSDSQGEITNLMRITRNAITHQENDRIWYRDGNLTYDDIKVMANKAAFLISSISSLANSPQPFTQEVLYTYQHNQSKQFKKALNKAAAFLNDYTTKVYELRKQQVERLRAIEDSRAKTTDSTDDERASAPAPEPAPGPEKPDPPSKGKEILASVLPGDYGTADFREVEGFHEIMHFDSTHKGESIVDVKSGSLRPLQFPDKEPPARRSHLEGRYIMTYLGPITWKDYPRPISIHDLPDNVSADPIHWLPPHYCPISMGLRTLVRDETHGRYMFITHDDPRHPANLHGHQDHHWARHQILQVRDNKKGAMKTFAESIDWDNLHFPNDDPTAPDTEPTVTRPTDPKPHKHAHFKGYPPQPDHVASQGYHTHETTQRPSFNPFIDPSPSHTGTEQAPTHKAPQDTSGNSSIFGSTHGSGPPLIPGRLGTEYGIPTVPPSLDEAHLAGIRLPSIHWKTPMSMLHDPTMGPDIHIPEYDPFGYPPDRPRSGPPPRGPRRPYDPRGKHGHPVGGGSGHGGGGWPPRDPDDPSDHDDEPYGDYHGKQDKDKTGIDKFKAKCTPKDFPKLTRLTGFHHWFEEVMIIARAYQLGEVMDPTYRPKYYEESIEFEKKLQWFYMMLRLNVKEPQCADIVLKYIRDYDAQTALIEMTTLYKNSTEAKLENAADRAKLARTLFDHNGQETAVQFLSRFTNSIRVFNERQTDPEMRISPAIQREYLQSAVSQVAALNQVLDLETRDVAIGRPRYTYAQYYYALTNAAQRYDANKARKLGKRRDINRHEVLASVEESDDDSVSDDGTARDGDHDNGIDAFAVMRFLGASMDKDTWNSLTDNGKKTWDDLSPADKSKILNYASNRAKKTDDGTSDTKRKPPPRPKKKISANTHDVDDKDTAPEETPSNGETYEANVHDTILEAKTKAHPATI